MMQQVKRAIELQTALKSLSILNRNYNTVKPANKDRPGEVAKVAFVHRWPLFGGSGYNM